MTKVMLFSFMLHLLIVSHIIADDLGQSGISSADTEPYVTFTVYNRNKQEGTQILLNDKDHKLQLAFIPNIPTKFITHGWLASENSRSVEELRLAFLKTEDLNIVTVGWSSISRNEYALTTLRVFEVGVKVGKMVIRLLILGLIELAKVHLIGHSLGAHVMGNAGGFIRDSCYGKVARITGLDPAKPTYELIRAEDSQLDCEDGQFVDVIHTCIGVFGYVEQLGHADFYPNGGFCFQPGCSPILDAVIVSHPLVFCGHRQAFEYFEKSIYNATAFLAVQCQSYFDYELNRCHNGQVVYMGNPTPPSARGSFYLKTSNRITY